jgi:hypothetical protein
MTPLLSVSGIGPHMVVLLAKKGISTTEQLATTSPTSLREIPGIGVRRADTILAAALLALDNNPPKTSKMRKAPLKALAKSEPVTIADKAEASAAPGKAAIKSDKDNTKDAEKKTVGKKMGAKNKLSSKKTAEKTKAKKKSADKKAAKKKAKKKAAKKKAKASKSKKSGMQSRK